MRSFLSNINRIPIISRHISGKAKLNPFADLQSRAPSVCCAETCSIHKFVEEAIDGVIDPGAKISKIDIASHYSNRIAWKKAQVNNPACGFATTLLKTGKPPPRAIGKPAGEYFNKDRFYCREATISRDGVLVAHSKPSALSGPVEREDLKNGLILLLSSMRKPARIHVTVDNAPGFASLISRKDKDLEMLHVVLLPTDEFNKNSNAVIDKGCQELEEEVTKLVPDESKLTQTILAKAVLQLNKKIRRKGNISAYKIHTAKDLYTGENLKQVDNQLQIRKDQNIKTEGFAEDVHLVDTVIVRNKRDKHKARDMFLVTGKEGEQVEVQKILHPLPLVPGKAK